MKIIQMRLFLVSSLMAMTLNSLADWKTEANARIEQLRKREVRVVMKGADMAAVSNAVVLVRQTRHAFPFGAALSKTLLSNTQYQEFVKTNFNYAVFENEAMWYANEAVRGKESYTNADAMIVWCQSNNIPVRGHCIFWEGGAVATPLGCETGWR